MTLRLAYRTKGRADGLAPASRPGQRATSAWRKKPVGVLEVSGNRAHIEHRGTSFNGGPELTLTDYSVWSGWVPVVSLTNVVENELEYEA